MEIIYGVEHRLDPYVITSVPLSLRRRGSRYVR